MFSLLSLSWYLFVFFGVFQFPKILGCCVTSWLEHRRKNSHRQAIAVFALPNDKSNTNFTTCHLNKNNALIIFYYLQQYERVKSGCVFWYNWLKHSGKYNVTIYLNVSINKRQEPTKGHCNRSDFFSGQGRWGKGDGGRGRGNLFSLPLTPSAPPKRTPDRRFLSSSLQRPLV